MNIYFYIFTEKVHQYDAQCIMTGGLFSCHQEVKQAHRPEGQNQHFLIICFVFSIGKGTFSSAKYSFFTTSTTAS